MPKARHLEFDRIEHRRLCAASPVDFTGQYLASVRGALIEVDLHHVAGNKTKYSGDLVIADSDHTITASQTSQSILSGTSKAPGGPVHKFGASLAARLLTVTFDSKTYVLTPVSPKPALSEPTLAAHSGPVFSFKSPAAWSVSQGTPGIIIQSADKTERVSVLGGYGNDIQGVIAIAAAQQKAGATPVAARGWLDGWVSPTTYGQQADYVFTFTHNGVKYTSMESLTTLTNYFAGTYNATTHAYSGQTLALISQITAPQKQFVAESPMLLGILDSIQPHSTSALGNSKLGSSVYSPGIEGPWFASAGFDYKHDAWLSLEKQYLPQAGAAMNDDLAAFDSVVGS
jgi:hypothetical protein